MSHELFYTSAPKGLRPGSRGFCTVAATQGLPLPLAEKVESLSGYRPLYPPLDAKGNQNPVVHSHLRITVGGKTYSVLSRISPAGLDYSQRANKFAHHVILEAGELPARGPAWLLGQPGFMESQWDGEVRVMPSGRLPPAGDAAPSVCRAWREVTGDAGRGGILADWFERDPNRQVYLLFEPGLDLLPLIAETVALLPIERRWQVSFSTYFTGLPQGIPCLWRCVVKDSPEAGNASRLPGQQVLNLCEPLGQAPAGYFVNLARVGRKSARMGVPESEKALSEWPDDLEQEASAKGVATWARSHPIRPDASFPRKSHFSSPGVARESIGRDSQQPVPPPPAPKKRGRKPWLWAGLVGFILGLAPAILALSLVLKANLENESLQEAFERKEEEQNSQLIEKEDKIRSLTELLKSLHQKDKPKGKDVPKKELIDNTNAHLQTQSKKENEPSSKKNAQEQPRKVEGKKSENDLATSKDKEPARAIIREAVKLPTKNNLLSEKDEWTQILDLPPEIAGDSELKLLGLHERLILKGRQSLMSVQIRDGNKDTDLAQFEIKDGKMSFRWSAYDKKFHLEAESLRNCILVIEGSSKSMSVTLRKPIQAKVPPIKFDEYRPGTQTIRQNAEFLEPQWDVQGKPKGPFYFGSAKIEIDKKSFHLEPLQPKAFVQVVPFNDSVQHFKWAVIDESKGQTKIARLSLGPDMSLPKAVSVKILSLAVYIKIEDQYVEVVRIKESGEDKGMAGKSNQ